MVLFRKIALFLFFLSMGSTVVAQEVSAPQGQPTVESTDEPDAGYLTNQVTLQALDKVTARVVTFSSPINKEIEFKHLKIMVKKCWHSSPEEPPESKAYLEIMEHKPGEMGVTVFSGWMFASAPSVSALEHPVYDVWLKECDGQKLDIPVSPKLIPNSAGEAETPSAKLEPKMEALYKGLRALEETKTPEAPQ